MPVTPRLARADVVDAAARLLATAGPRGLTARAVAREVGTSTMAVYTHFSGMPEVIHAVIAEGFARLDERMAAALARADREPVAQLRALAHAYRDNALANPYLYAAMFGGEQALGQPLTAEDYRVALHSLRTVAETAGRARELGRFGDLDEWEVARRLNAVVHGAVSLELGGYLGSRRAAAATFTGLVDSLLTLLGGSPS